MAMLYLVFGHTAKDAPLRRGPLPSFSLRGPAIVDHMGAMIARHNGQRWEVDERPYYRVDCSGPVVVKLEGEAAQPAVTCGPFEHFSLFNGTAYASREVFAHYNEQDSVWDLQNGGERSSTLLVLPA